MKITGRLHKVFETVTGESENGFWSRRDFVVETLDSSPKKVCFTLIGDNRVKQLDNVGVGAMVVVDFMPESKCITKEGYEEKWFTTLKAFGVQVFNKA